MPPSKKKDKMVEDFSGTVATVIPENIKLAKSGKLDEAIENLYVLEKQTRQAEDAPSTSKLANAIIRLCYEAKDYKLLNQHLHTLAKRRGQLRTVIQEFVKEAMTYLDSLNKSDKLELIETLRTITEGKMFVEIERARLTRILAKMKEDEGKSTEAADILQEVQVEAFGQMERKEKTEYILEQVRLCLDKKDYIKAQIISNKINKKILNEPEFEDLKLDFYAQMIRFYAHESKYLDICRSYLAIYETPKIKQNEALWKQNLQMVVIYVCLAANNNEQSDMMNRINEDKNLLQLPIYKQFLNLFITKEIMNWPDFQKLFAPELNKHSIFTNLVDGKNALWIDLHKRVMQHNIRIIALYYNRITSKRMSQLLNLSWEETEKFLSDLVVEKSIFAKIDRPTGIISFRKRKDPNEFLNEWSSDISQLLVLLEKTCHLINRENMVHKVA